MVQRRKRKKNIKMRASRTHGYGSHKKHRGAGSRGGRGMAGSKKHKKTWIMKYKPGHLGKQGFKSLQQRKLVSGKKAINVRDLAKLSAGKKELDVTQLGYDKVLGGGSISVALTVKATYFTESARIKIEQAKGKVIVISVESADVAKVVETADSAEKAKETK